MAEQLICNQQVVGSTPITSSKKVRSEKRTSYGGFPERPKGADCKSVVTDFGGPNPPSPTRKKDRSWPVFFSTKFALRASEIASRWNICFANVKYSLTRMWANFISHCIRRMQYFTIYAVNYFTFFRQEKYFTVSLSSSLIRRYSPCSTSVCQRL